MGCPFPRKAGRSVYRSADSKAFARTTNYEGKLSKHTMSALWCVHTSRRQAPAKQQSQPQPQRRPAAGDSQQPFAAVRSIIATSANMIASPFFAAPPSERVVAERAPAPREPAMIGSEPTAWWWKTLPDTMFASTPAVVDDLTDECTSVPLSVFESTSETPCSDVLLADFRGGKTKESEDCIQQRIYNVRPNSSRSLACTMTNRDLSDDVSASVLTGLDGGRTRSSWMDGFAE